MRAIITLLLVSVGLAAVHGATDARLDRLERKLDQFIDTQSKTNELVERRLQAAETERGNP